LSKSRIYHDGRENKNIFEKGIEQFVFPFLYAIIKYRHKKGKNLKTKFRPQGGISYEKKDYSDSGNGGYGFVGVWACGVWRKFKQIHRSRAYSTNI
jgi:hypothetical protein